MLLKRLAVFSVALAAGTAFAVAPASAAKKNPYTPGQVCGSGFAVIDSQAVSTPTVMLGTVYLLYNAGTGQNCVAAMKTYFVGKPTHTGASLRKQGAKAARTDSGNFKYYAGPVKWKAAGKCVEWGGGFNANYQSAGFLSAYEHCG